MRAPGWEVRAGGTPGLYLTRGPWPPGAGRRGLLAVLEALHMRLAFVVDAPAICDVRNVKSLRRYRDAGGVA